MSTIRINEIFGPTIQGEGKYCGVPTLFVRLNGCNLRCAFAGGSICDTSYTSHNPEHVEGIEVEKYVTELMNLYDENLNINHLVVTGGEPMLQQNALFELLKGLLNQKPSLLITIETNGTIIPKKQWSEISNHIYWSVSPKLENSCCFEGTMVPEKEQEMHIKNRVNYDAVLEMMRLSSGQLKFVYSDDGKSEKYIKNYLKGLHGYYKDWPVMVMPEGQTQDQITISAKACVEAAIKNGWQVADRLHIRIWGSQRGV